MGLETALGSLLAAFGLSGAAGLNAWLPLFPSALLARLDVVELAAPFDDLTSTPALVVARRADGRGLRRRQDPGGRPRAPSRRLGRRTGVRAILFTGQTGLETDLPTLGAILLGGTTAGSIHAARAAVRPVSTATTGGLGNPVLSLGEDAGSVSARRHGVRVAAPRARPRRLAARRAPRVVATAPRRPSRRPTRVARCYPAALHAAALHPGRVLRASSSACASSLPLTPSPTARSTCTSSTSEPLARVARRRDAHEHLQPALGADAPGRRRRHPHVARRTSRDGRDRRLRRAG